MPLPELSKCKKDKSIYWENGQEGKETRQKGGETESFSSRRVWRAFTGRR